MSPFTQHSGIAAPLLRDNVDTDTIIPSREMRSTGKTGLRDGLFAPWRYRDAETRLPDPDFVLNQPAYASATILAAGDNFGCGSSREHAVWALADYGIRCIVAESFAPIFYNNCVRNGLLPVELDRAAIIRLAGNPVFVDLATQTISCEDEVHEFAIGAQAKLMLLGGFDAIDMTLLNRAAIDEWCRADRIARPWIYLERRA